MKETTLASCLVVAFGITPKSVDGKLLSDWKRATNSVVGDFSIIASHVMAKNNIDHAWIFPFLHLILS
jgi:hypothetical protein